MNRTADETIAALYGAAVEDEQWRNALTSLAHLADGRAACFFVHDAVTGSLIESHQLGLDDTNWATNYFPHYSTLDLAYDVLQQQASGRMHAMHKHLSDSVVDRSEYYQDFYLPSGMRYSCGGITYNGNQRLIMAVHRPLGHRPYDEQTITELERVLKHLPNVFRMRDMATKAREGTRLSSATLDALPHAVIVVDITARIQYLNTAAQALLKTSRDLQVNAGRLLMTVPRLQQHLVHRVQDVCRANTINQSSPIHTIDKNGRPAMEISVLPLRPEIADSVASAQPLAMLMLRTPFRAATIDWPRSAARPYDLSVAEFALAVALAGGAAPAEYADRNGVKISTVRSQIQSIMAKTGTRRSAEIVALFAALQIPLSG